MSGGGKPVTQKRSDPLAGTVRVGQNDDPPSLIGGRNLPNQLRRQGKSAGYQAIRLDTAPNRRYIALAFYNDHLLNQSSISLIQQSVLLSSYHAPQG